MPGPRSLRGRRTTPTARKGVPPQRSKSPLRMRRGRKKRRRTSSGKRSRNAEPSQGAGGSLRRTPLTRTTRTMMKTTMMILRGWLLALTGSCRTYRKPTLPRRMRGPPRCRKVSFATGARRRRPPTAHALTLLLLLSGGNPFQRPARDIGSKPLWQGC